MPPEAGSSQTIAPKLALTGNSAGRVKLLSGFRKKVHKEPDAANEVTQAFLARICADELASEAESFFQHARTALHYKRRDLALDVSSPMAVLTARDFTFEITYTLQNDDPASYNILRNLHHIRDGDLLRADAFNDVFTGLFSSIVFTLSQGVPVEHVIDAIEGLDGRHGLAVAYPSDCSECAVSVKGISAQAVCDGATLEMRFDKQGSPRELLESFEAVRSAFAMSEDKALAALL